MFNTLRKNNVLFKNAKIPFATFILKNVAAVVVAKNRGHIGYQFLLCRAQYITHRHANTLHAHTLKASLYSHCLEHSFRGGQRGSGSNTHNSSACVTLHPLQLSVSMQTLTQRDREESYWQRTRQNR